MKESKASKIPTRIYGMQVRDRVREDGSIECAFFDIEVVGFNLRGCCLTRTKPGGFTVSAPLVPRGSYLAVEFVDDALRAAVIAAARTTYIALNGRYSEWGKDAQPKPTFDPMLDKEEPETAGLAKFLGVEVQQ